jgi:hypothetical protein
LGFIFWPIIASPSSLHSSGYSGLCRWPWLMPFL